MLSLISLGRTLWQKVQAAHPVIRWGGAILVGLVVLEFVAQEAISLYVHMQTARATIEQANELARKTAAEAREAAVKTHAISQPPVDVKLEDGK
jgi:enoyl-[acyl-carrier-protein] reductase (NADH)